MSGSPSGRDGVRGCSSAGRGRRHQRYHRGAGRPRRRSTPMRTPSRPRSPRVGEWRFGSTPTCWSPITRSAARRFVPHTISSPGCCLPDTSTVARRSPAGSTTRCCDNPLRSSRPAATTRLLRQPPIEVVGASGSGGCGPRRGVPRRSRVDQTESRLCRAPSASEVARSLMLFYPPPPPSGAAGRVSLSMPARQGGSLCCSGAAKRP